MLFALINDITFAFLISSKAYACITVPDNCGSLFSPMLGCKGLVCQRYEGKLKCSYLSLSIVTYLHSLISFSSLISTHLVLVVNYLQLLTVEFIKLFKRRIFVFNSWPRTWPFITERVWDRLWNDEGMFVIYMEMSSRGLRFVILSRYRNNREIVVWLTDLLSGQIITNWIKSWMFGSFSPNWND